MSSFKTTLGGATGPQPGASGSQVGHIHHFTVKCHPKNTNYVIVCDQPRTVLEAIKSTVTKMFVDENILIQLGTARVTIATHFPCSCIGEDESLLISHAPEKVEEAPDQKYDTIQPRDKYSVFYIRTEGGRNTKQKKLFKSKAVKQFHYVCVYGEKDMTVEKALERDGRFIDNLGDFILSYEKNPDNIVRCTQKIIKLDGEKFLICLPKKLKEVKHGKQQGSSGSTKQSKGIKVRNDERRQESYPRVRNDEQRQECYPTSVLQVAKQRGISVIVANSRDTDEVYKKLREQFPHLKKWMESRFSEDSYQKALDLRKEDFGKIQQSFSEVHRLRKLIDLGKSVCKVVVGQNVCQGTGFVLFDELILTNAHILGKCVEGQKLKQGVEVYVIFNYEEPEPNTNYFWFTVHPEICCSEGELDYAILRLKSEGHESYIPPGLLSKFGPLPLKSEACIIGHPAGQLKKMDPTCIIEKERREQNVSDHFKLDKNRCFILHLITGLKEQGIESIMTDGDKADKVATYNTFMYHGSSGSPVFDAQGQVFGLHTAGFTYGFPFHTQSVIEYAQPLLAIFEDFVCKLKEYPNEALLRRVAHKVKGNSDLEKVFEIVVKGGEYEWLLRSVKIEPAHPDEHPDPNEYPDPDEHPDPEEPMDRS